MSLNPRQREAVEAAGSVCVVAGAGTGKTHMLSHRYLFHLQTHGFSPLEIVAATFTEKAVAELRARIRQLAAEMLSPEDEAIAELEAAQISTIHSLAARICREHPDEAEVPPDFEILNERPDGALWLNEQLDLALESLPFRLFEKVPPSVLRGVVLALLEDPLLAMRALAVKPDAWEARVQALQGPAFKALLSHPLWLEAKSVLSEPGDPKDERENHRLMALGVLDAVERCAEPSEVPACFEGLAAIDLRKGSRKEWGNRIKDGIRLLREFRDSPPPEAAPLFWSSEVDPQLAELQPALKEAYEWVSAALEQAKREARLLAFADLEVHALRALRHPHVLAYYQERWKAYLIDEFQDTNPVQGEILEKLCGNAVLTIVGDPKQSIYGFRRADLTVFESFQAAIESRGGKTVVLEETYRTHQPLMNGINSVFREVLGSLSQDLASKREAPNEGPHITWVVLPKPENRTPDEVMRRAEGQVIAREIQALLDSEVHVFDSKVGRRPLEPGDIAVLCRTSRPLEIYGEALAAAGIPVVLARGGNLFETREALDGIALLGVLAEPVDNLSLVAVLRSPFFALSDQTLHAFGREVRGEPWWPHRAKAKDPALQRAFAVLEDLVKASRLERPSRLLQLADRLCGYTAVLANLPGAARREADWLGFARFIQGVEGESQDVFTLMRRLTRQLEAGFEVERPPLEARDAVTLMTIHASKGLEWPVVFVPNLSASASGFPPAVRFDDHWGVTLKFEGDGGDKIVPFAYRAIEHAQKQREKEEEDRIYYVAFTRARDRLILSSLKESGGPLESLLPGFEAAAIAPQVAEIHPADLLPPALPNPSARPWRGGELLTPVGSGLTEIPVAGLAVYAECPQRFKLQIVDRHPGLAEEPGLAVRIGVLTHLAIEKDITDAEVLALEDPLLPKEAVAEALELAEVFRTSPVFEPLRREVTALEAPVWLRHGKLSLSGRADGVGPGFVVDFKTDRERDPERHALQLWAYAKALDRDEAYIAYLRHNHLERLTPEQLSRAAAQAEAILEGIRAGDFVARVDDARCAACAYNGVCGETLARVTGGWFA